MTLTITARTESGPAHRERIRALVSSFPDCHLQVLDLMYRLTSPAFERNGVRLWEDEDGSLVGFALWQSEFRMLDYGFDPRVGAGRMAELIVEWACASFQQDAGQHSSSRTCWIKVLPGNGEWIDVLEARGFARCRWSLARMEAALESPTPEPHLLDGFRIRPVAGTEEIESIAALHRAVFPRVGMTDEWRRAMMASPTYRPDLDLVVTNTEGELAAFCQGWIADIASGRAGQIEPLGTHPRFRGHRLGRAVLLEVMQRMHAHGARRVWVETWDDNHTALHSYGSVGFHETYRVPTLARTFG